jgi:HEAT repeat protein
MADDAQRLRAIAISENARPLAELVPGLPREFAALVDRCLQRDARNRFPSGVELLAALEQLGPPRPKDPGRGPEPGRRWPLRVLLLGLGLAALAAGYGSLRRLRSPPPAALGTDDLMVLSQRAINVLGEYLRAPSGELRLRALSALSKGTDVRLYPVLAPLLADPDAEVRAQAAEALGQLGERKALPALAALLTPAQPSHVQVAAAHALVQLGEEHGAQALRAAMTGQEPELRLRAAFHLCEQDPQARSLLRTALLEGQMGEPLRLNILTCMTCGGDETAQKQLQAQLGEAQSPRQQLAAAARLYRCGDPSGQKLLHAQASRPGPQQLVAARLLAAPDEPQTAELLRRVAGNPHAEREARLLAIEGLGESGQSADALLLTRWLLPPVEPELRIAAASSILLLCQNDPSLLSGLGLAGPVARWAIPIGTSGSPRSQRWGTSRPGRPQPCSPRRCRMPRPGCGSARRMRSAGACYDRRCWRCAKACAIRLPACGRRSSARWPSSLRPSSAAASGTPWVRCSAG